MMCHDQVDTAALFGLDALSGPESTAVLRHAEHCPDCRARLAGSLETAAELALVAAPVPPGDELRRRILEAAAAVPQHIPLVSGRPRHRTLRPRRRRQRCQVVAEELRFLEALPAPIRTVVPLTPAAKGVRMAGQVYVGTGNRAVGLVAAGLPDPGEQVYQLWLLAGGQPVPMEAFRPDASGRALVRLRSPLQQATAFAVSVERTANPPAPLGPIVLSSA